MKDYSQIISRMKSSLWLMQRDSLETLVDIVNRRLDGEYLDEEEIRVRIESASNGDRDVSRIEVGGGLGLLSLYGPIFPKSNLMTELSGATSLELFRQDFRNLLNNDKVDTIVIDIDSPGGSSEMVEETGDEIRAGKEVKPVIAVANTLAASAAHWLGSQATEFYSTPSGGVGSIGVYTVREDKTTANEAQGRKIHVVSAGKLKATGNPDTTFSEEEREYLQEQVDHLHDKFIDAVATGRGVGREEVLKYADGRIFFAEQALELGMIDGIRTLDSVVESTLSNKPKTASSGAIARAMSKGEFRMEVVDKEHSEPGTTGGEGGEPTPREEDDDRGQEGNSRIERNPRESLEGGNIVNPEEQLAQLRNLLSLSEDSDLVAEVTQLHQEVQPIREAESQANRVKAFREAYPEEAARLENLERIDRENNAAKFSSRYERFTSEKDGKTETRPYGFSAKVLEDIKDVHLKLSNRELTHSDLSDLLDHIADNGIVDYTERGSSRVKDADGLSEFEGDTPAKQFASAVKHYMTEDDLDRKAAVVMAAKNHPDLYAAYRNPRPLDTTPNS